MTGNLAENEELLGYLRRRRSVTADTMIEPGPDEEELGSILNIAARVPDHGKLEPWRFIIIRGEARISFADKLAEIYNAANPGNDSSRLAKDTSRIPAAPVIIAVVSTAGDHVKVPVWEQELSAGAVYLNLIHGAAAHGYIAQWLTAWLAYDAEVAAMLGLSEGERVAGYMHIGSPSVAPVERARPDIEAITSEWTG